MLPISNNLRRAAITVLLSLAVLTVSADELTDRRLAQSYLKSLPAVTTIQVWPGKLRFYELLGEGDISQLSTQLRDYDDNLSAISFVSTPLMSPALSIYLYDSLDREHLQKFSSASRLPGSYKRTILRRQMDFQACAFTSLIYGDWTVGGALFVDKSVLSSPREQEECLTAALDSIEGFPTTDSRNYKAFPSAAVRRLIVEAAYKCSAEGPADQRTRSGLTPKPSIECVIDELSK